MTKNPITLRSTRRARTPEEIAAHDKAVKERESAREARRTAWLEAIALGIVSALHIEDQVKLLREACEAFQNLD